MAGPILALRAEHLYPLDGRVARRSVAVILEVAIMRHQAGLASIRMARRFVIIHGKQGDLCDIRTKGRFAA
jgi:hypothetical protein